MDTATTVDMAIKVDTMGEIRVMEMATDTVMDMDMDTVINYIT